MILCFHRLPADGTLVQKHVGVGTYHELCFVIYILLYFIKCLCWLIYWKHLFVFAADDHWRPLRCVKAVRLTWKLCLKSTELGLTLSFLLANNSCYRWECHLSDVRDGS